MPLGLSESKHVPAEVNFREKLKRSIYILYVYRPCLYVYACVYVVRMCVCLPLCECVCVIVRGCVLACM